MILLHNPEHSLADLSSEEAFDQLAAASRELEAAKRAGLCSRWGISSWDTRSLERAVLGRPNAPVKPDVLMVRAGLLVGYDVLEASERLFAHLDISHEGRWGMSPFGGNATASIWSEFDPRLFLEQGIPAATRAQAVFRAACDLPFVHRVATGTDSPSHLAELALATGLQTDEKVVSSYRALLRRKQTEARKSTTEIG
ncbi:hypothetical protein [Actinosynnema mirum]|uniref:hypothetical protein n=1 Tax=Actinosynnema mirum TaxID=40567 RepID=UPI00019ABD44|nr:hypothetical protein [Actinosynnema mirum]